MVWRVFGGGVALAGVLGVVLTVAALFHGESAAAPIGVVGLLLLALGLRLAMVPPVRISYHPPRVWTSPIFHNEGTGGDRDYGTGGDGGPAGDRGGWWGGGGDSGSWGGDGGGGWSGGGGGGDGGGGGS